MEQTRLEIKTISVTSLVPYSNNAKKHPAKQVQEIANSIAAFGNCDPIAVWTNEQGEPEIVEGHGRVLALAKLGIDEAPVIFLDHLTDEQRRAYCHTHNQTTLSSGFDSSVLFDDLDNLNFEFEDFGFDGYALDAVDINVDEVDGRASSLAYLSCKNKKWLIADDECDMLIEAIEDWISETGLPYGFVRSVLNG